MARRVPKPPESGEALGERFEVNEFKERAQDALNELDEAIEGAQPAKESEVERESLEEAARRAMMDNATCKNDHEAYTEAIRNLQEERRRIAQSAKEWLKSVSETSAKRVAPSQAPQWQEKARGSGCNLSQGEPVAHIQVRDAVGKAIVLAEFLIPASMPLKELREGIKCDTDELARWVGLETNGAFLYIANRFLVDEAGEGDEGDPSLPLRDFAARHGLRTPDSPDAASLGANFPVLPLQSTPLSSLPEMRLGRHYAFRHQVCGVFDLFPLVFMSAE